MEGVKEKNRDSWYSDWISVRESIVGTVGYFKWREVSMCWHSAPRSMRTRAMLDGTDP